MIQNGNPRQLMLFCGIAALLTATLTSTPGCRERCYDDEVIKEIGEYQSKEAGLNASIPELALLVARCPATKLFRVIWVGPGNYPDASIRHSLLYHRTHRMIGYEDDFLSGISGRPYYADDSAIRAVAEKQEVLTDFTLYERRPW